MVIEATFTGLVSIVALLQWREQSVLERPCTIGLPSPDKTDPHEAFLRGLANKRKGAIVIYTPRTWRGTTLHLVPGLQEAIRTIEAASNVVERRIGGQRQFLCYFPTVPPGHYRLIVNPGSDRPRSLSILGISQRLTGDNTKRVLSLLGDRTLFVAREIDESIDSRLFLCGFNLIYYSNLAPFSGSSSNGTETAFRGKE